MVVAGVPVDIAGNTSITTSCVEVPMQSKAKNFAVVVPKDEVATGVQVNFTVEVAQRAPSGSTEESSSMSPSGSVAVTSNSSVTPRVVEALAGPENIGR